MVVPATFFVVSINSACRGWVADMTEAATATASGIHLDANNFMPISFLRRTGYDISLNPPRRGFNPGAPRDCRSRIASAHPAAGERFLYSDPPCGPGYRPGRSH